MTSHSRSLQRWTAILSLTLGALVAGMAYLLWQDARKLQSTQAMTEDVSSIRIQRQNFLDIVMIKTDEQWNMESPCLMPVNQQRLSPLLGVLAPGAHQYPAGEVDLQAAGLETPLATIYFNGLEHRIGNTDLKGERRYLQRGDKVEFVPEWALSLVNGGVTALAQLELFDYPLRSLSITDNKAVTTRHSNAEELDSWQNLSAQQILTWPVDNTPEQPTLSVKATSTQGNEQLFSVFETEQFTAVKLDDAKCAYILAPDALPD